MGRSWLTGRLVLVSFSAQKRRLSDGRCEAGEAAESGDPPPVKRTKEEEEDKANCGDISEAKCEIAARQKTFTPIEVNLSSFVSTLAEQPLFPQPPRRCQFCRQFLDDPSLRVFLGDPENAVSSEGVMR